MGFIFYFTWIIAKIWISRWNINTHGGVFKSCWLTLYLPEQNLSVPNHCLCGSLSCCLPKDVSTGLITSGRNYVSEKIPRSFSQQLKALSLNVHNLTLLWMQLKGGFNLIVHGVNQEHHHPNLWHHGMAARGKSKPSAFPNWLPILKLK